jgi:hypothetical protein
MREKTWAPRPSDDLRADQVRELLTEMEVHFRYGIAPRSLQRWRMTGDGPAFVRVGARRVLYRVRDIENWLDQRTFASTAAEFSKKAR